MNLFDVRERAQEVLALTGDPEAFHCKTDELIEEVLREIALGNPSAQGMAQAVIPLLDADIAKWYA